MTEETDTTVKFVTSAYSQGKLLRKRNLEAVDEYDVIHDQEEETEWRLQILNGFKEGEFDDGV